MSISNFQATKLALLPGLAECTARLSDSPIKGFFYGIALARNAMYLGAASATYAIILLQDEETPLRAGAEIVTAVSGIGLAFFAGWQLVKLTTGMQMFVNPSHRVNSQRH